MENNVISLIDFRNKKRISKVNNYKYPNILKSKTYTSDETEEMWPKPPERESMFPDISEQSFNLAERLEEIKDDKSRRDKFIENLKYEQQKEINNVAYVDSWKESFNLAERLNNIKGDKAKLDLFIESLMDIQQGEQND